MRRPERRTAIDRRRAIGVIGVSVGAGIAGLWARRAGASGVWSAAASQDVTPFPRGSIIRTVLSDVAPASLDRGALLFHEHLSLRHTPKRAEDFSDETDLVIEELKAAVADGVACIVDATHPDTGQRIDELKRISSASKMPIVACGGYYMQNSYPPALAAKSAESIADDLVAEARANRLGAFGEIGQQAGTMTADEQKVFRAVGLAHVRTGLPVFTHNAYTGRRTVPVPVPPDAALRQLDILESAGVKPSHVAIGHVCCLYEPHADIAKQIAKRGAFVGFDRASLEGIQVTDEDRIEMIKAFLDAGYVDHLLLSSDFFQASALKRNGGPGFAKTVTVFGAKLLKAGVPDATLRHVVENNARRFMSFVPASH